MATQSISFSASGLPVDGNNIYAADVNTTVNALINDYNLQIGTNKIANSAITNALIADGTIKAAKINAEALTAYTPVFTGFSADPSGYTSRYIQYGNLVIWMHTAGSHGTSNATTFTMTLPVACSASCKAFVAAGVLDNSVWKTSPGQALIDGSVSTTVITLSLSIAGGGGFTASGTKDCSFLIIYETA